MLLQPSNSIWLDVEAKMASFVFSVQAQLAAVQTANGEGQARHNQQIQQLQAEIVSLPNEKEKETWKMQDLVSRLEQG